MPGRLTVAEKEQLAELVAASDEPNRGTLERLRRAILGVVPDAQQFIYCGMPAFEGRRTGKMQRVREHGWPHSLAARGGDTVRGERRRRSIAARSSPR